MKKNLVFTLLMVILFGSCTSMMIDLSASNYKSLASKIELGDTKEEVLSILMPSQQGLPQSARKNPDRYIKDGVKVEIFYMRSGRQPDGLTTDDEFVPYIFNDNILVGIGWQVLGGPKTQGQASSNIYIDNSNKIVF